MAQPFLVPLVDEAVGRLLDHLAVWILRNPDADPSAVDAAWAHVTGIDSKPLRRLALAALGY